MRKRVVVDVEEAMVGVAYLFIRLDIGVHIDS